MSYLENIKKEAVNTWRKFISMDGISKELCIEDFFADMQVDKERVAGILNSNILCKPTLTSLFKKGVYNYFIVNDPSMEKICKKCTLNGIVVLLQDKNYLSNLSYKFFLPSYESYCNLGIDPNSIDFVTNFPVPVNPKTDYWYCPHCNEVHKFDYSTNKYLEFDQAIIPINVDLKKYEERIKKERDDLMSFFNF